jgi:thiol-disulfide isomerase/thioredoxin/uncharacterized membrane protein
MNAHNLRRSWPLALLAALLLAGTAIAVYLTHFHENALYGDTSVELANCPRDETTNCEAVNTSAYSDIAGVPISAFGIPAYVLLIGLVALARRRPRLLSYVFTIGLLTVLYSGYLYYVSTVKIGFLCVWCFRLYGINASIPILAILAASRGPGQLLREMFEDVSRLAPEVWRSALVFAGLLVLTILGDLGYRSSLTRVTGAAPVPAGAESGAPEPAAGPVPAAGQAPVATQAQAVPPGGATTVTTKNRTRPAPARPVTTRPVPAGAPQTVAPDNTTPPGSSPTAPATESAAAPAAPMAPGAQLVLTTQLKEIEGHAGGVQAKLFDLQARIGKGRPVALLFWAPGFTVSESALVDLSRYLKDRAPRYDVYAIAGRREDQRPEMLWERFCMLDRPADLPLLMDDGFALSKQLDVTDVPDLVLADPQGRLVVTKIKGLEQLVSLSPERVTSEQMIDRVAQGAPAAPVSVVPPYYPASELFGRCAPEFTLVDVMTHHDVTFTGRSPNGRPTLLVFWSSTCKHCQKEIPQLIAYVRSHPDAVNVVSVSLIKPDRPDGFSHRRVTEAYIRNYGITWPVLDDSSGYADDLYRVVSTPTTFLISPGGQILDTWYYTHPNLAPVMDATIPRLAAAAGGQCRPASPQAPSRASFSVTGPDGETVPLQRLTDRPSLVHLWATWCQPCQTELPGLLKFRRALEGSGGRLVLVSVEDATAADRIKAYGSKFDPAFASYRAPKGGLADLLDLSYSVPRTFVVAKDGEVLKTFYGAQPWDDPSFQEKIRALLQLPARRG